jgi:hypothetical protein
MATTSRPKLTPKSGCGFLWMDMLGTGEKFLRAGLRHRLGPNGDVDAAYRQWYEKEMEEHDQLVAKMCDRFESVLGEKGDAS